MGVVSRADPAPMGVASRAVGVASRAVGVASSTVGVASRADPAHVGVASALAPPLCRSAAAAERGRTEPGPNRTEPAQTGLNRPKPARIEPNRTEPDRSSAMAPPTEPAMAAAPREPFHYDYESLRLAGLILSIVMFVLGVLIALSKKFKCKKAEPSAPEATKSSAPAASA